MDGYWYIWFEIFEDNKFVSRGRYYYPYLSKSSAERRAKQMWSSDLYNPMTKTLLSRKWIVSQTNPWEENDNV
jgi:hypothetical protein